MRYYCPRCWKDFSNDYEICPYCGLNIKEFWSKKDKVEKLIIALNHPEGSTRLRAAWLLGKEKDPRALPHLIKACNREDDLYLIRECIKAIGLIGGNEAEKFLLKMRNHPATMIKNEAQKALKEINSNLDT